MKHIEIAMEKLDLEQVNPNPEHMSIVEQILRETRNPKIAAVLALDLMLVGVDTVSELKHLVAINRTAYREQIDESDKNKTFRFFLAIIRHLSRLHRRCIS
jgi:hypothetical protein